MNNTGQPMELPKSQVVYWIFQFTGWGAFSLSRFIGGVTLLGIPWTHVAVQLLLLDGIALGISHALRDYVRRHQWSALPVGKLTMRILAAAFVVGVPLGILTQFTELSAFHDPAPLIQQLAPALQRGFTLPILVAVEVVNWAFVFGIWLTIYFFAIGLREYRSAKLKQSELASALHLAELRLLKSQLNPHFLFNALNTVRSLIADNPARAQQAVTRLATTLRYTLSSRQEELVTLSQELAIVTDYLELESMRFEDRLQIETHVPDAAAGVYIPVMLLQTLVENAVKHGIAELPAGGLLRLSAALQDGMLIVEVENPRPPATLRAAHESVGLRNAHDRLRLLFGARASLELDLSKPTVAIARLRIPVQR